jgi:hypothetical protein
LLKYVYLAMLKRSLILVACLFSTISLFGQTQAQDTIFLMNGHIVAEKVIDSTLGAVTIYHPKKHSKKIHYEWDQLYMVKYANGYKRYYYYQDSTVNNWFTKAEMWMYMKGEIDARKGFRAPGSFIGATIAGLLGGMSGTIWGPVAPYTYMALTGIPKVRIRHHTVSNPKYLESDAYILGYERVARQRRKIKSLIGGTIGLAIGYGIYALFNESYPQTINVGFNN